MAIFFLDFSRLPISKKTRSLVEMPLNKKFKTWRRQRTSEYCVVYARRHIFLFTALFTGSFSFTWLSLVVYTFDFPFFNIFHW